MLDGLAKTYISNRSVDCIKHVDLITSTSTFTIHTLFLPECAELAVEVCPDHTIIGICAPPTKRPPVEVRIVVRVEIRCTEIAAQSWDVPGKGGMGRRNEKSCASHYHLLDQANVFRGYFALAL